MCRGFVSAQLEYAAEGRDGDPPGIYALKLVSDQGLHNGLYWPTAEDEPASPAGPFVAAAAGIARIMKSAFPKGTVLTDGEPKPTHAAQALGII